MQSGNQKKGILELLRNFYESLLFKQGFPKDIWISSSSQLGEHPNFGLNAEEGFP